MRKIIISLALLSVICILSCGRKYLKANEDVIDVRNFGAVADDKKDDSASFLKAIQAALKLNKKNIIIPSGEFDILSRITIADMDNDLKITGSKGTIINCPENGFIFFKPKSVNKKLKASAFRHTKKLILTNTDSINSGDILRIHSDSSWETGWGYKENDTHIIADVIGSEISLNHNLVFNYDPEIENVQLEISKPVHISFENIEFVINSKQNWKKTPVITCTSTYFNAKNIKISDINPNIFHRGISLANCPKVTFENLSFENLEYGVLMNYCREIRATNISAIGLRHALAPANACIDMYASDIFGKYCQGVIDAHQSFNIHYNNVRDIHATQFSNCRALGTKITNSFFSVDSNFYQDYCYWSNQLIADEYKQLYEEYDTEFENVNWVHSKPSDFNGLTTYTCRNFIITKCTTHNISLYGQLYGKAIINNSTVGNIRINSHNVEIGNCVFDGKLFQNTNFVLRFSGVGNTSIFLSKAVNYEPLRTDLFEYFYNTSSNNSVSIKNSNFCKLKHWSEKLIYPNLEYTTLFIENSKFEGFVHKLPSKIFNKNTVSQNIKNISGMTLNSKTIE